MSNEPKDVLARTGEQVGAMYNDTHIERGQGSSIAVAILTAALMICCAALGIARHFKDHP